MYCPDGDDMLVTGSNFARETHPAWTANLLKHPDAAVSIHGRRVPVRAALVAEPTARGDLEEARGQLARVPGLRAHRRPRVADLPPDPALEDRLARTSPRRHASTAAIASAAPTSARCDSACGVLPACRPPATSYSSLSRPTSLQKPTSRSMQRRRVVDAARLRVLLDEPERAGEERVLAAGQAVDAGLGAVAQQQAVAQEVVLDRGDGAEHPRVVGCAVADLRRAAAARRRPRCVP